ncbi:MAG TPA: VCBS repeat-containing protein, partial [Solirubrobacterales bacterium]|nr:VCBS repeat-containing protein [Solirubrobacterales bacterium]
MQRYNAETGEYEIRREGKPTEYTHLHELPRGSGGEAAPVLGAFYPLQPQQDDPICAPALGHRIVVVRSYVAGQATTPNAHDLIRSIVKRMNWKFIQQASMSSSGLRTVQMVVQCSQQGVIDVLDVQIPLNHVGPGVNTTDGVDTLDAYSYVRNALGAPEGARAVKYLVFHDGVTMANGSAAGLGGLVPDASKAATNLNRTSTSVAITTRGSYGGTDGWESGIPIHELLHAMGASYAQIGGPAAPFANVGHHCVDGIDILCYEDGFSAQGPYTETRCPEAEGYGSPTWVPIDCGYDTYFDARPEPGEWLSTHWNLGDTENPYVNEIAPPLPDPVDYDVDGDLRADLVTLGTDGTAYTYGAAGDTGAPALSFYGTMQSALYHGEGHHVIDVSDVDGDHRSDMVTMTGDGLVHTYWGQPGGGFSGGPLGHGALSFGNSSGGSFSAGIHDADGYEPIAVADVTGDRRGDLVAFHPPSKNLYAFAGQANGSFSGAGVATHTGSWGSNLHGAAGEDFLDVADVNGDGHADLIGMGPNGDSPSVRLGTAGGQFGERMPNNGLESGAEAIGVGDVNGDGRGDLTVLENGEIRVHNGLAYPLHSKTEYTPASQIFDYVPASSFNSLNSSLHDGEGLDFVGVMDYNSDGRADLIAVEPDGTVRRYPGRVDSKFGAASIVKLSGFQSNRFEATPGQEVVVEKPFWRRAGCRGGCVWPPPTVESDLNGDRRADLITLRADGAVQAAFGKSDRTFSPPVTVYAGSVDPAQYDGQGEHVVDVADVDADRRPDLITLHSSGSLRVYRGRQSADFGAPVESQAGAIPPGVLAGNGFEPIAVADVTGDNLADFVAFNAGDSKVHTFPGQGNGTFGAPVKTAGELDSALFDGSGYYFLDVVNVTGLHRADLVMVDQDGVAIVIEGQPDGTFAGGSISFEASPTPLKPVMLDRDGHEPVAISDVNGDGSAELVTQRGDSIHVYAADDYGVYKDPVVSLGGQAASTLYSGVGHELVGVLDIDGDGRGDLVSAHGQGDLRVHRGNADLTFATPVASLSDFRTTRHGEPGTTRHEIAIEKPSFRRRGCARPICRIKGVDADVDGDDRADLVSVDAQGDAKVFRGATGAVTATEPAASLQGSLDPLLYDGKGRYPIDVADVDGDGRSDLVTIADGGLVQVHAGRGSGSFGTPIPGPTTNLGLHDTIGIEPIAVADVTGDGRADLVHFSPAVPGMA